nr:unnamed protein product [Callosobruchus analis]
MNRILTAPQKQRKAPIYDPIARSIAEYISNNVPERLHNVSTYPIIHTSYRKKGLQSKVRTLKLRAIQMSTIAFYG